MSFIYSAILGTLIFHAASPIMIDKLSAEELPNDIDQSIQDEYLKAAQEPGAVIFTPPQGWHSADPKALPQNVRAMVIGKGSHEFPPSINLGIEPYTGTLKQYLKRVKEINESQGIEWKDLGKIRTEGGEASLSQIDKKTQWGTVRMMHVILNKNDNIYILTAASLKEEFPKFYKDFFNSMRSLRFNPETEVPKNQMHAQTTPP